MFLDWKNKYCQNDYTTQGNPQGQSNPYQITNGFVHRTRTTTTKLNLYEITKDPNHPKQSEERKWSWRNQVPWLQTIPQSYSHQNSLALAKKTRNVDQQNRIEGPEINPCTYGQLVYNKRGKNIYIGEKTVSSISGAGKTDFFNWNIVGLLTQCCVDSGVQQSNSALFIIIKNHSILLTCNKFTQPFFFFFFIYFY